MRRVPLWTPLLATLVFLPWMWALPTLHAAPLQSCGGPARACSSADAGATPSPMLAVGAIMGLLSPAWTGPGAGRRYLACVGARHAGPGAGRLCCGIGWAPPFCVKCWAVFLGTVACVFAAGVLSQWTRHRLPVWTTSCRWWPAGGGLGRRVCDQACGAGHLCGLQARGLGHLVGPVLSGSRRSSALAGISAALPTRTQGLQTLR